MKNDYFFWESYLIKTIHRIEILMQEKEVIYADFHMHSDYSADGKQSLEEIISRANTLGLDIIAITDHDSINVYDELYDYLAKNELKKPIIVPGVEFTVENNEYGSQCHILQLLINPKEKNLISNIEYNEKALWTRIDIQFKRIRQNMALQYFFEKYNINCSKDDYKEFLKNYNRPIPEYSTLMDYLMTILSSNNISTWDLFYKLREDNENDKCEERKQLKEKRYKILEERYIGNSGSCNSTRFLHSMLAIKGVDDDYFPQYDSCGSLSVNQFNQLKIEQLNKNHLTIVAHPNEEKIDIINNMLRLNNNISGMEFNKQTKYSDSKIFFDKLRELNMIQVIGSDSHSLDSLWYEDMSFYVANKGELKKLLKKAEEYINLTKYK